MKTTRHVLLIAYINSHLPELLRVAAALQQTGRFHRKLLFVDDHEYIQAEFVQRFEQQGVPVIDRYGRPLRVWPESSSEPPTRPLPTALRAILAKLTRRSNFIKRLAETGHRTVRSALSYPLTKRKVQTAKQLLRRLDVDLIVLCEENAAYLTSIYTKTGQQLGIPSVIVPYTIANATEAAEHAYDEKRHWVRSPLQRFIARRYSHWVYRHNNRPLLLLNPIEIMTQERLGLAPPDPWMINSGFANAIAAESPFMVNYYRTNHIPRDRIVLTGTFTDDVLHAGLADRQRRREELNNEYGLDANLPLLLCAFPPPWFPRLACDFSDYHQLIDFWISALRRIKTFNVILNLHPKINQIDRQYIAGHGLPIIDWDVSRLIPLSDLYVANISATIRWAIACGLPVLNYDVYKYRFHDYDTAPGVVTIESSEDFLATLDRMTHDQEFLRSLQTKQQGVRAQWGLLDGHSGRRMIQLFDQLITQRGAARS